MTRLSTVRTVGAASFLCIATAIVTAQTFDYRSFDGPNNGAYPQFMSLVQGTDGNFYGTTDAGGANGEGMVFKVTSSGVFTRVHSFCSQPKCADGAYPYAGLTLATNGYLYGTTEYGMNGGGSVFKLAPNGVLTTLYSFCSLTNCVDGSNPYAAMVQAADGNFYGTTAYGGDISSCSGGCGTIYRITGEGNLTTIHSFTGADGSQPFGNLVQAPDGNLYGTTSSGGGTGHGTVFKIAMQGALTTLHSFDVSDGAIPYAGLVLATDGNFYGTTLQGGGENNEGSVFRITASGILTTLYRFCSQANCYDGGGPYAGLMQATDSSFYGTTAIGGVSSNCSNGCGTVFEITAAGALTTLHSFDKLDGEQPYGGLVQATNGTFGGTATEGGVHNYGTAFSLNVGLGPFVTFVRAAGRIGQTGGILGQGFTGTTSVSFNGISASFTVVSDTFIEATVPAGATTSYVTVSTPSGLLTSNVPFHVIK